VPVGEDVAGPEGEREGAMEAAACR
jgi:hypothetical protein